MVLKRLAPCTCGAPAVQNAGKYVNGGGPAASGFATQVLTMFEKCSFLPTSCCISCCLVRLYRRSARLSRGPPSEMLKHDLVAVE